MVMRAHCDRCDTTITDSVQTWLEERSENGTVASQKVWHISIRDTHGDTTLCGTCRIAVLDEYLRGIKMDVSLMKPGAA